MTNKRTGLAALLLVLLLAGFGMLYTQTRPQTTAGEKTIYITVIHADSSKADFTYQTDAEYLGEVLLAENLVSGEEGQYGLFITTVDGETADSSRQQWWCITKDCEKLTTSADTTPLTDGDAFALTLTEGY